MEASPIRDRVKELRRVRAGDLVPDPRNWREHPQHQLDALQAVLQEIGFADVALARELPDGRLGLIDGHARRSLDPEATIPVVVLDVDEAEAGKLLLTLDPLASLAEANKAALEGLLKEVKFELDNEALKRMLEDLADPFKIVTVALDALTFHPRNYRKHPDDELDHLIASISEHGFYRNVVVARDNTVLAGQGVVQAARKMGRQRIPVIRLDLDPNDPRAWKVLTSDNEISNLAEVDDRALTELLKEIMAGMPDNLRGTGFDFQQLANLAFVTRPASEIANKNEAAEWVGMPEYENAEEPIRLVVSFSTQEDRDAFMEKNGLKASKTLAKTWSAWYPPKQEDDYTAVRYQDAEQSRA